MKRGILYRTMRLPRCGLLLLACLAVMLTARLIAPSALQRFDQPKTVSYTADMVVNGRWLIPRDAQGNTATKPPLVNWLASPFLALGVWEEYAVKVPMVLGSLATLGLTVWMAGRFFRRLPEFGDPNAVRDAACLAGIAWLVNPANLTMIYHCRPDPVLVAFMTGAWMLGTIILLEEPTPPVGMVAGFWACIGLAALTKGPAALVPVVFLPLAARFIGGRWSLVHRSRWWWGFPLAVAMLLAWAIPSMLLYPQPFWDVLVGREMIAQALGLGSQFGNARTAIPSEGPIVALKLIGQNPQWFVERFAPWSVAALGGLVVVGWRRWFVHSLASPILWVVVVIVFFALSAHKTADYILPAYPAAAILAVYFCHTFLRRRFGVQPWQVATVGLVVALGLALNTMYFTSAAKDPSGEKLKAFANKALATVGADPVVFVHTGDNTLQFFMHRHQPGAPSAEDIARAKWVIMPDHDGANVPAALVSEPLTTKQKGRQLTLALYHAKDVRSKLSTKVATR